FFCPFPAPGPALHMDRTDSETAAFYPRGRAREKRGEEMTLFRSVVFAVIVVTSPIAMAAGDAIHYPQQEWSFDGPFGTFDKASLQRGFLVYKQVCAACQIGRAHV